MGNWARPYLDAQMLDNQEIVNKCIAMRDEKIAEMDAKYVDNEALIKYNELVFDARKLGLEDKNYDKAFELLDEAEKLYPEKFDAQWGRATSLFHIGKHKESLQQYDKIIKEHPDFDRLQFERCLVLMEIDHAQGIEDMIDFLSNHDSFQYFWRHIGAMYENSDIVKSLSAYKLYLEKYPEDYSVIEKMRLLEAS